MLHRVSELQPRFQFRQIDDGCTVLPVHRKIQENVVAFSEYNAATSKYCIITIYGGTAGTGTASGDFKREWNNLVVKQMTTELADPKTDTSAADGWTVTAGGSSVTSEAGTALAFLTVISGTGTTVSILAVFNDPAYVSRVDSFVSGICECHSTSTAPDSKWQISGAATNAATNNCRFCR